MMPPSPLAPLRDAPWAGHVALGSSPGIRPLTLKLLAPLSSLSAPSALWNNETGSSAHSGRNANHALVGLSFEGTAGRGAPPSPPPSTINTWGWGPREARPLLQQLLAVSALQLMGWGGGPQGPDSLAGHGTGAFLHSERSAEAERWAGGTLGQGWVRVP